VTLGRGGNRSVPGTLTKHPSSIPKKARARRQPPINFEKWIEEKPEDLNRGQIPFLLRGRDIFVMVIQGPD